MPTFREHSRKDWHESGTRGLATIEEIKTGSLQRIADAVEKMGTSIGQLERDRDYYKRQFNETQTKNKRLRHQIIGLRGAITRMKRERDLR
jgi:uncharacterized protein YoxC